MKRAWRACVLIVTVGLAAGMAPVWPQPAPPVSVRALCLLPDLPVKVSNNAVAAVDSSAGPVVFSFMGLEDGKTADHISRSAFMLRVGESSWRRIADVPVPQGRLAATAQAVAGKVFVFGGYSVAADGSEKSEPEVLAFDPDTQSWSRRADMPVPVDDTVSFSYRDRYVYLVSGWHDVGNQNRVQLYDARTDTWLDDVTEFPGKAVFGHAGAAVDNRFVIIDGVAVVGIDEDGRRRFAPVHQAYEGTIDPEDPRLINWIRLPDFDRPTMYRAAAAGDEIAGRVLFAGGSETAYNYDGTGYNGTPAAPLPDVVAWNVAARRWQRMPERTPTMDHRGLVRLGSAFYTVGGMTVGQTPTSEMIPARGAPACE